MGISYIDNNLKKIANFLREKNKNIIGLLSRKDIIQNIAITNFSSREITEPLKELLGSSFTKLIYDGTTIPSLFFRNEDGIIEAYFPNATRTGTYLFQNSRSINTIIFDNLSQLNSQYAFSGSSLKNLIIKTPSVCSISSSLVANAIFSLKNLKAYVPDELLSSYKSATNWTVYKDRIFPLSDYYEEV